MSEGKNFWNRIVRNVPGTKANKEILANRTKDDAAFMEANYEPLKKRQNEILDTHREDIFTKMLELDSKNERRLDLRELLPELKGLYREAASVDDSSFHLT